MKLWHVYKHKNGKDAAIVPTSMHAGDKISFMWVSLVSKKVVLLSDIITDIFTPEYQEEWLDLGSYDSFAKEHSDEKIKT